MQEGSFGAIYIKLHHGTNPVPYDRDALKRWIADWRALGIRIVGWGWLQSDATLEADLAVALCREYDLDGYIANAETPYEDAAGAWRSRPFVTRFRYLAPRAPLALSGLISNPRWTRAFDYLPWIEAGAYFRPQLYEGEPSLYRLPVEWGETYGRKVGFPIERIQPDILGVTAAARVGEDCGYLADGNTVGFGIFLAPPVDDDYRDAGIYIRNHGIARLP